MNIKLSCITYIKFLYTIKTLKVYKFQNYYDTPIINLFIKAMVFKYYSLPEANKSVLFSFSFLCAVNSKSITGNQSFYKNTAV